MLYSIILSLVFTILIELVVSILCGVNKKSDIRYITLINILTNPITELINLFIKDNSFHDPIIIIIEVIVIIIEYSFYKKILKSENINLFYLTIINNVCSYVVGVMFNLGGII